MDVATHEVLETIQRMVSRVQDQELQLASLEEVTTCSLRDFTETQLLPALQRLEVALYAWAEDPTELPTQCEVPPLRVLEVRYCRTGFMATLARTTQGLLDQLRDLRSWIGLVLDTARDFARTRDRTLWVSVGDLCLDPLRLAVVDFDLVVENTAVYQRDSLARVFVPRIGI